MNVSDEQLRQLRRFLDADEEIVWAGQPSGARAMRSALPILAFAIPWTAFSLFWIAMAGGAAWFMQKGAGSPGVLGIAFPLFGVPFVLVGLWMLLTPYRAWRSAQKTLYVVTNRRLLVGTPEGDGFAMKGYDADKLDNLDLTVRPDGSGTIEFSGHADRRAYRDSDGDRQVPGKGYRPHAFADVPDVEAVFDRLRALARRAPLLDSADAPDAQADEFDSTTDAFRGAFRGTSPGWKSEA